MQPETKGKYLERLSAVNRQLQLWMAEYPEGEDRIMRLWQRSREVENGLLDGTMIVTTYVSNQLNTIELSLLTLGKKLRDDEEVGGTGQVSVDTPEDTSASELGAYVMNELASIQGRLIEVHARIVEKHPVLGIGTKAVDDIKVRSVDIGITMKELGKLAGVL